MADEPQATPEATPVADPPAPPAPALSGGPWQQDIEASFTDPQVRANVDAFLRAKVQPRMTQFEQQIAQTEQARQLWEAFQEDPAATYQQLTAELESAGLLPGEQAAPPPDTPGQEPAPADPRLDEMYGAWKEQQELQAYDAEVDAILADPANQDVNRDLYHGFVAAADGDYEQAIALYREDSARRQQQTLDALGISPEQLAELQAQRREQAPPVIDGSAGGGPGIEGKPQLRGMDGLNKAIENAVYGHGPNADAPPVT